MTSRHEVVASARSLLGTPFHHQGRLAGVGVDCAGVPILVCRMLGLKPPEFDVIGYPRMPDGKSLKAYCDAELIPTRDMDIGDVVLIRWRDGDPQHLGILGDHIGGLSLIHADSIRQKRVIESGLRFTKFTRLVQAYRIPGVD